jgi:ubiquinone/menaquinone biosynthesis C-methylase UbiE
MTPEQLQVARSHRDYHAAQFGYAHSNVEFIHADIERLEETDLEDGRFDLIVSNCVINLATDKRAVLDQAYRLLKPGGEMYFCRRLFGPSCARCINNGSGAIHGMLVRRFVLE